MKLLVLMHRLHDLDPKASFAPEALELATRGGAAAHGIDAGILRVGALADVIVVDATRPHMAPLHRPSSGIVYSARASDVEMNIIGGEIVVEDGRCTLVDQDEVIAEAKRRAGELMERVGLHELAVP
jgi:5-methylthioadenosine/S-adenosylhomocysteine deaminase